MISLVLGLITKWRWIAIGGAALLALSTIGVLRVEKQHLARDLAAERVGRLADKAQAFAVAAAATEKYRALEALDAQHQKEAADALQHDRQANAVVVADLARQLGGVRNELAAYASGSRNATPDTLEACGRRASALGDVLAEALRVQGELAGDAEGEAAGARSLLEAWPVTPEP